MNLNSTILVLLLVAVGVLAQTKAEVPKFSADDWEFLADTDAVRFYVNKKPATQSGQTIRAWERVEFRTETVEGQKEQKRVSHMTTVSWEGKDVKVASYAVLIEYNCAKSQFKERRFIFYDVDGTVIEALPDHDGYEWKQVSPNTVREALRMRSCKASLQ